jgi:hypothetical protein
LVVQEDASKFDLQTLVQYMTTGGTSRSGGSSTKEG